MTSRECKFFTLDLWFELWSILTERRESVAFVGKPSYAYYLLTEKYQVAKRQYHGLYHIDDCVAWWYLACFEFEDPWVALLSLMLHDCKGTVLESASELERLCKELGFDGVGIAVWGKHHIMATEHTSLVSNNDSKLVCDIDLLPLAYKEELFDQNTELIRREYTHLTELGFYEDRILFLAKLAERGVFQHQFFHLYEEAAQANIARVIKLWQDKLSVSRK